ncbi:MAG TPA: phosphoenolpyruvate carboxylase, partial [Leptolyngbya sp.]|nr:phosphoenolpyruvate carboxylase [Leptolyngbya sp.]
MSSTRPSPDESFASISAATSDDVTTMMSDLFLRHRLRIVEDLWETVLRQECGQELVDLLNQLRQMCSPEGQATTFTGSEVLQVVEKLDLNEAIRAARAFALYFQLINIVEQHYEQRDQQLQYRVAREGHAQP